MSNEQRVNRRAFLAATGVGIASATAGCLDFGSDDPTETPTDTGTPTESPTDTPGDGGRDLPSVAAPDEPVVYRPSHVDGRKMIGMQEAGPYMMSLMYTLPHDFWVFGGGAEKSYVSIKEGQNVHIMSAVWEPEYGQLLPTGNPDIRVAASDGQEIDHRSLWSMLAQQMGPHFGDNVGFPESGEYTVTVDVDPVSARQLGAYVDRFNSAESATFDFEFSFEEVNGLPTQFLNDAGRPGALPPADMDMRPTGAVPDASGLPGEHIGTQRTADADFVVQLLESAPNGIESNAPYLAVSPRTPYNNYPLPFMGLRAVSPDRDAVILPAAIHPELGYHYGEAIPNFDSDEEFTLNVGTPPQISRHRGYQTAFIDFEDLKFTGRQ